MSSSWPFNQIHHVLWRSKRFRSLTSDDDRLLLLWYMTCEHQNAIGVFRCPDHWAAADLQWEVARVKESRQRLGQATLIRYDEDTDEVYVDQWLRFTTKPNRQVFQGYVRQVDSMESDVLRNDFVGPALHEAESRWTGEPSKAVTDKPQDNRQSRYEASLARNQGRV